MGSNKRMMEEHQEKLDAAMQIALQAGVLKQCIDHEECVFEGSNNIEDAYKLGNTLFTSGKVNGTFSSRREMTDLIKEVVEAHPSEECPRCAKNWDED